MFLYLSDNNENAGFLAQDVVTVDYTGRCWPVAGYD
jgi:hypothetical protein